MYRQLQLFDKAQFGVIRTDLTGHIVYANEWMSALLGRPITAQSRLRDFVSDSESLETLVDELRKRGEGHSGEYFVTVDTPVRPRRLQIFGTPVREEAGVVGSVAFVTRAPIDPLRDALLTIGVTRQAPLASLTQLHRVLEDVYQFDSFVVAMYDTTMQYSRVLYTYFKGAGVDASRWRKHWVRLTPTQRDWIVASTTRDRTIADLDEFLRRPEWSNLRDDPMSKAMLEAGIRSVAGIVVREGAVNVASVSLLSKLRGAYDEEVVLELHELPIDRVVLAAVNAQRDRETAFRHEVIRRAARCHKINELSNCVVKLLGRQYQLARVALFSIDWADDCARLRSEKVSGGTKRPQARDVVPLQEGLIARVARLGEPQYIEDIGGDEYMAEFLRDSRGSAFCWPVSYYRDGGDKLVRWVFVAIDEQPAAFSPGERETLVDIAADIGGLLQRLTELHFMTSTFNATSDAILVVDGKHEVRRANVAAAELFGLQRAKDVVGDVGKFFHDPEEASAFLRKSAAAVELQVVGAGHSSIPAMVSIRTLPDSIGGKVLAFEDLRKIRRLEELSFLGRVASAISVQVQTPLTLASSWVQRIGSQVAALTDSRKGGKSAARSASRGAEQVPLIVDLANQTHTQLRRIQACLDRIALYDPTGKFVPRAPIPVSLGAELEKMITALPASEQGRIRLKRSPGSVVVNIHPEHLTFVVDTLLAFFLRDLPGADKLTIRTGADARVGWIECQVGRRTSDAGDDGAKEEPAVPFAAELGLVEHGLRQIVEGYGGAFKSVRSRKRISLAQVQLPLRA